MKLAFLIACFSAFGATTHAAASQTARPTVRKTTCGPPEIRASVEVAGNDLSLADLLAPGSCPRLVSAAAQVILGAAPRAGIVRVLEGSEVRARFDELHFEQLQRETANDMIFPDAISVPERIMVRRSERRASCTDIGKQILDAIPGQLLHAASITDETRDGNDSGQLKPECGSQNIPQRAKVELIRTTWDEATGNWKISARCVHSSDCLPFLVRVPDAKRRQVQGSQLEGYRTGSLREGPQTASSPSGDEPSVHRGQRVTLLWDQDGIRAAVRVICLDAGAIGETVRARVVDGGRVLRAVIVSKELLRVSW